MDFSQLTGIGPLMIVVGVAVVVLLVLLMYGVGIYNSWSG